MADRTTLYRAVGVRLDVYGPKEVNNKPGVARQLVLLADDGTKGTLDDPPTGLDQKLSELLTLNRDVTFRINAPLSDLTYLDMDGEKYPLL